MKDCQTSIAFVVNTPLGRRHGNSLFAQEYEQGFTRWGQVVQKRADGTHLLIQQLNFGGMTGNSLPVMLGICFFQRIARPMALPQALAD
jgi:hypothetical protein